MNAYTVVNLLAFRETEHSSLFNVFLKLITRCTLKWLSLAEYKLWPYNFNIGWMFLNLGNLKMHGLKLLEFLSQTCYSGSWSPHVLMLPRLSNSGLEYNHFLFHNEVSYWTVLLLFGLGSFHLSWWIRRSCCSLWSYHNAWTKPGYSSWGGPCLAKCCTFQFSLPTCPSPRDGWWHQRIQDHHAEQALSNLQSH